MRAVRHPGGELAGVWLIANTSASTIRSWSAGGNHPVERVEPFVEPCAAAGKRLAQAMPEVRDVYHTRNPQTRACRDRRHLLNDLSKGTRERILERRRHSSDPGRLGYFEVSHDVSS